MKVELRFFQDAERFEEAPGQKITYTSERVGKSFHISPHPIIWETDISEQLFFLAEWSELPAFPQRSMGDLPFDPIAGTFFLASRYEEYLPYIPDEHGRFTAEQSFSYKNNFLNRPLINEWALALGKHLWGSGFELSIHYSYTTTVDIDNMFAYKGKGALRTLGAIGQDIAALNLHKLRERLSVLWSMKRDPYNTFRKQKVWNKKHGVPSIYFMLWANFGPKDRNVSPYSTEAAKKLREVADWATVGIHPSYDSDTDATKISREIKSLQNVIHRPITQSRQHYLKLKMPLTFRTLLDLGITDEHSMGYAELPGFRASICTPFRFYDLELDLEQPLTVHPFAFMDVTFLDYAGYSPERALEEMLAFVEPVKKVGGHLISIWHNRIFSEHEPEWKGSVRAYKAFIQHARA